MFLFYLLSTIKVKLVDEMMQSAYMCNIIGDELLLNFGAKFQR